MALHLHRPRQVVGLICIVMYLVVFFTYAFIRRDDQSWTLGSKFSVAVLLWFILSLAVKVSMVMNRIIRGVALTAKLSPAVLETECIGTSGTC